MAELLRCYRHPDRETGVSCSDCGRGICPDCMVFAPVGIRCPDHAGQVQGVKRVADRMQWRAAHPGIVTKAIIATNVGIYLLQLAGGATLNADSGWIFEHFALVGVDIDSSGQLIGVSQGEWWRLLTAAFLHYGPIHLGMNMLAVWWIGRPLEDALGPARYPPLSRLGLAGSAGALIASNPRAYTVGASGAIFGILGAAIVLERQRTYVLGGSAITLLVLNLAFTFAVPGISIGGHLGGLAAPSPSSRSPSSAAGAPVYARHDLMSYASLVAVGVASIAVAYWKVRGYVSREGGLAADGDGDHALLGERGLGGGKAGERDAIRAAGDVVEPEPVAEGDGLRLAAVLAADAQLDPGPLPAAALDGDLHQVADPLLVDRLERVALEHAALEVIGEEAAAVVARDPERRLRQVVRAEGEEVGVHGDLVRAHAGARQLDHRPDAQFEPALLLDHAQGELAQALELLAEADERMHDLDERRRPVRSRTARAARTIARTCVS